MIELSKKNNINAIAITDDGMYGAVKFAFECKKENIKPIIGAELNLVESVGIKEKSSGTVILLVQNQEGYKNLCRLISMSYRDELFYYVPRIDLDALRNNSDGLLCLMGHKGVAARSYSAGHKGLAEFFNKELLSIFADRLYYIVSPIKQERYINYVKWLESIKANIVLSNCVNFLSSSDYEFYDFLSCTSGFNLERWLDPTRYKAARDLYFKNDEELLEDLSYLSENSLKLGISNNEKIVDRIDFKFDTKIKFPILKSEKTQDQLFDEFVEDGWKKLEHKLIYDSIENYKARLAYEIDVIKKLGYINYFVVVTDFVNEVVKQNIRVGYGRGSVAGSLVAYILGITKVDPLRYGLIFERFLNPAGGRVTPPDIDIDFDNKDRDKVVEILYNKYGEDQVCGIANLVTLAFKSSLRDSAKVLGLSFQEENDLLEQIPFEIKSVSELKELYPGIFCALSENERYAEVLRFGDGIKGSVKNTGTHAAGVLITPGPLVDYAPLEVVRSTGGEKTVVCQYDKSDVEKLGLTKIDVLGLAALNTIKNCINFVSEKGQTIDLDKIDLEDRHIYRSIQDGDTAGLFQLEGRGMTALCVEMGVSSVNDICDLIALYRPQVLQAGMHHEYIENKKFNAGRPIHENVSDILETTHNVIVYQEQNMLIAQRLAGFTFSEADLLRKAGAKKTKEDIKEIKTKFINGCVKNGLTEEEASSIFKIFEDAGYLFNRCLDGKTFIPEWGMTIAQMFASGKDAPDLYSISHSGVLYKNVVEEIIYTGRQEVFQVELSNGELINCTMNHKFLCTDGIYHTIEEIIKKSLELTEYCAVMDVKLEQQKMKDS